MRLRTVLAPLAAMLATTLVPGIAHAAVPRTKATQTLACPGQPGKVARIWWSKNSETTKLSKLAMDNPCSQSLWFFSATTYASGKSRDAMLLKPGTHFNWGQDRVRMYEWAIVYIQPQFKESSWECGGPTTVAVVSKYNDVRYAQDENGDTC
jgi:hypothetical protein